MNSSGRSNAAYFCRAKHSSEMFHQAPPETKVQPAKALSSPELRERLGLGRERKHGEVNQLLPAPFAFPSGEVLAVGFWPQAVTPWPCSGMEQGTAPAVGTAWALGVLQGVPLTPTSSNSLAWALLCRFFSHWGKEIPLCTQLRCSRGEKGWQHPPPCTHRSGFWGHPASPPQSSVHGCTP